VWASGCRSQMMASMTLAHDFGSISKYYHGQK
jgi:hypothetical protein